MDSNSIKPNKPVIGLTGGIGSGKTAVSNQLAILGATVIDTDVIAHDLTAPQGLALPKLIDAFGPEVINEDGAMNRAWVRELVFHSPMHKQTLEGILHPMIRDEVANRLQQPVPHYFLLVVPLLFEKGGWTTLMDKIVVVDCDEQLQIERVMKRSGLTEAQVQAIIRNQVDRQTRLNQADYVISNNHSNDELVARVCELHTELTKIASN